MSHFLNIPSNENGIITDLSLDVTIKTAAAAPFAFTDVFIYSHGWWTSNNDASSDYNRFSIGYAYSVGTLAAVTPRILKQMPSNFSALAAAIYWPSVLSEDTSSLFNLFEATSYFTMQGRADTVGTNGVYALLRLLIEARKGTPPLRFHLIGHSFGCRAILSALQRLTEDPTTLAMAYDERAVFRVVLIQAAADQGCLSPTGKYPTVLTKLPSFRLLVTTSQRDTALGTWYPRAQDLAHFFTAAVPALGATGPTGVTQALESLTIQPGIGAVPIPASDFCVADITALHDAHKADYLAEMAGHMPASGQHTDIFIPELYELVAKFTMN